MAHKMQAQSGVSFVYKVYKHRDWATMGSNKTSQERLKDGWIRATFILRKDYLEKLKALAYWERKKIREVIDDAHHPPVEVRAILRCQLSEILSNILT